ncbi:Ras-related protein Rab-7L1 [Blattella germanica]|nr:Ras-related protein Rab-7L1 [Blattella germanica]
MKHVFKIILIGDVGVGKTSIVSRYVNDVFSRGYRATIGVEFAVKTVRWDDNNDVKLHIWDIAGTDDSASVTHGFCRDAAGVLFVFDIMETTTFNNVAKWKQVMDTHVNLPDNNTVPCVLLANKVSTNQM